MKYLIAVLLLFCETSAKSEIAHEVCYADINQCVVFANFNSQDERIFLPVEIYNAIGAEERLSLVAAGLNLVPRTHSVSARIQPYLTSESRNLGADYQAVSEEADDLFNSATLCGGETILCAGAAFSGVSTYGITYWLMKVACVGAGVQCVDAFQKYNRWRSVAQDRKAAEDRDKPSERQGESMTPYKTGSGGFGLGLDFGGSIFKDGPKGIVIVGPERNPEPQ